MPWIEVVHCPAPLKTVRFDLKEGPNLLGRERGCDVEIPDPRISSRHALLTLTGERVEFIDQNSTNGIHLNGEKLRRGRWPLEATLQVGETRLQLKGTPASDGTTGAWNSSQFALSDAEFDFNIIRKKEIPPDTEFSRLDESERSLETAGFAKRMHILNRMIKSANASVTIPDLLNLIMTSLFEAIQCDTGYILLVDPVDRQTVNTHMAYEQGKRKPNLEERHYSRTLVSTVIRTRAGIHFGDKEGGEENASRSIIQLGIKNALCCPIHSGGEVYGVVYLDNKQGGGVFTGGDLDLAMNLAGIAGVVIENLKLYKELETEALIRDHLKRYLSPNVAEMIVAEKGGGSFHLQSRKTPVTVLFADIRGFTSLAETLAPLEVARLLNNYFSEMSAVVFANGGTLDKFIGDCMMVLFNAPVPLADHEHAAVQTALQMRRRLRQAMPEWRARGIPNFQVGIGVNSGEVVAGAIGTGARMEYTAIGDAVNIASRMCSMAKPGQILITDSVHEKVSRRFRTVMLGATQLKGRSQPILVHEVVDDLVFQSPS